KKASAVVGDSYIGGIAGEVYEMADCSVSSSVSSPVIAGNSIVGGAAGNFTNDRSSAKIERVTVSCNIYGDGYVGGIVGRHKSYGTLTECAYKGTISTGNNSSYIGGIIGYSECTVLACKADAKISVSSGSRYVGGIVGYRIMILAACYSTGEITGVTPTLRNYIGAISGDVSGSKCVHCYSTLNLKMDGSAKTSETGTDSYTVASLLADFGTNINLAEIMRATNSSYASYWNYDKTWRWTGTINGESVTAICPKLSWEK
ncbi:MAG: hypothetical protein IJ920_04115, partial [Paludibacteraceae bacterium]|nr:hypothetical protein [Paludibacteraceae bacterium]